MPQDKIQGAWAELVKSSGVDKTLEPHDKITVRKSDRFTDGGLTYREQALQAGRAALQNSWLQDDGPPLSQRQLHQEALQKAIENVRNMLPMEKKSLVTAADVMLSVQGIRNAADPAEHDEVQDRVKEQALLVGQLGASLKSATTELNSVIKKRKAQLDKMEAQKRTEALKAESQKAEDEKRRLQKQALMDPFRLEFSAVLLPAPLLVCAGDAAFKEEQSAKPHVYSCPFVLKESEAVKKILQSDAVSSTLKVWAQTFPRSKVCQANNRVIAPLDANRGNDDESLKELLQMLAPNSVSNGFPRFEAATNKWFLFGENDTSISSDFEHEFLGSIRLQVGGTSQFYGLPVDAIVSALGDKKQISAADIVAYVAGLDQARLQAISEAKSPLVFGSQEPESILVVPPGWVMSYATVGDGPAAAVHGLRRSVLLNETLQASAQKYELMLAKNVEAKEQAWLQFLNSLATAEMKKSKASAKAFPAAKVAPMAKPEA